MKEFLAWWLGELRESFAFVVRLATTGRAVRAIVHVAGRELKLVERVGNELREIPLAAPDPAGAPGDISAAVLRQELTDARTALSMPANEILVREFELPLAAERHLASALELQLERALPLPLASVFTDRRVIARDRQRGVLTVRVAVARREVVERWRALLLEWRLQPIAIGVVNATGDMETNFLRRRRDPIRWTVSRTDKRLLWAAAAGLVACLLVAPAQWIYERQVVGRELARTHEAAARTAADRDALLARMRPLAWLRATAAVPAAADTLATLSGSVPADAWFHFVEINARPGNAVSVRLIGSARSANDLVNSLRAVPGVQAIDSKSSFTGEFLGQERLELSFQYAPKQTTVVEAKTETR